MPCQVAKHPAQSSGAAFAGAVVTALSQCSATNGRYSNANYAAQTEAKQQQQQQQLCDPSNSLARILPPVLQELRATGKPVASRPFVSSASPTRPFTPDTKLYSCLSPPPGAQQRSSAADAATLIATSCRSSSTAAIQAATLLAAATQHCSRGSNIGHSSTCTA
jgi:hypothetical protein